MKKLYFLVLALSSMATAHLAAQTCNNVSSFPFKETFEADSPSRSCWTQQVIGGHNASYDGWIFKKGASGGSDYNIVNAHSGQLNACTQISANSENAKIRIISPKMDVTALQTPTVSFFMGQEYWGISQNQLNVYYRLSANSEWKILKNYFFNVPDWKQAIISLPEKSAELQLCFEAVNKYGRSNVLDDIVVGNSDSVEHYPSTCTPSTPSNNFETGTGDLKLIYIANDFNVAAHTNLTVNSIKVNTIDKGGIESFSMYLMKSDNSGLPSEVVKYYPAVVPNSVTDLHERDGYTFRANTFDLPEPAVLMGGATGKRYWLVLKALNKDAASPSFWESTTIRNSGKEAYYSGDGALWKAASGGADGVFSLVGSCTETNPTDSYCTPKFNFILPIDQVKIGTIDNLSFDQVAYEDFSTFKTDVERGKTYPLEIKAQTFDSNSNQALTVFIDWNQNGYMGDEGETYQLGKITQASGNTLTYSLPIPISAALGDTKMRIISNVSDYANYYCGVFSQGQAEDYTLVVKEKLAVASVDKKYNTIIFPNPADHFFTIQNEVQLLKAEILDLNGRKVLESTARTIDVSHLAKGVYLVRMTFKNGQTDVQKLIKQ